jgi:lipopolysaccharide export system protein LptA
MSTQLIALDSDKKADFVLDGDNFKNLPEVKDGVTKVKFWGNVVIEQGTLKINADEAVIFNTKSGMSKIVLTGNPATMEQIMDVEYGKINVRAKRIDFMKKKDLLIMKGDVVVKSRVQGEMSGEEITMNLKTKEIQGEKSDNKRVRLIIKPNSK